MTNFHWYVFEAKWRENVRVPYIPIELPLAACSGSPVCLVRLSSPVAGWTLTSAPVSTKNCRLVTVSQRKRGHYFGWPLRPLLVAGLLVSQPGAWLSALASCLTKSAMVITQFIWRGSMSLGFGHLFMWSTLHGVGVRLHFSAWPESVGPFG